MSLRRPHRWSVLFAVVLAVAACEDPFTPQATTLQLSATSLTFSAIGASQSLTATVLDQRGTPIGGATIAWSSNNPAVATVSASPSASAVVAAAGNGSTQIVATSGTATAQAAVTVTQAVTALLVVSGDAQTDTAGQQLPNPLTVQTNDANGHGVQNITVTFEVIEGDGSLSAPSGTTGPNGRAQVRWTLGLTAGEAQAVRATAATGSTTPVTFGATAISGPSSSVVVSAGNNQSGLAGFALNVRPAVLVRDASDQPIANAQVDFAATDGGSVSGTPVMTDVNGIATVGSWTVPLGTSTLTATVTGTGIVGSPLTFTATGVAPAYAMDLRYLTGATPAQRQAFDSAKAKWQRLIYGDVPDVFAEFPAGTCGPGTPAINDFIDDLHIFVRFDSIDGPGKILGRAGPCIIRDSINSYQTAVGVMQFDTADVANLLSTGAFGVVVLHEMGHVLGLGTLWELRGLLVGPAASGGTDPHFVGLEATSAFDRSGGANYSGGAKVPVENCVGPGLPPECGDGNWDGHWRETVFRSELMTGFLNQGANPLSVVSTASMGDLAYTVNHAGSDAYTVPTLALRDPTRTPSIELKNDILRLPIRVADAAGRVVRVIQPR